MFHLDRSDHLARPPSSIIGPLPAFFYEEKRSMENPDMMIFVVGSRMINEEYLSDDSKNDKLECPLVQGASSRSH